MLGPDSLSVEIARIPVAPAQADALIAALDAARADFLSAPACRELHVLVTPARDVVVAVIGWASSEAHQAAAARPEAGAFFQTVAALAAGQPSIGHFAPAEA
ncbi:MAG: antibiotic biosynthesis monooxygenase [Caulobacteraceae bacterium]